jgi:hypothetical protein
VTLPDPVPLGVCGSVVVPRAQYLAAVDPDNTRQQLLLSDAERLAYVAQRLDEALDRPLTAPGSEGVARSVLSQFGGVDVLTAFAEKAVETMRDGQRHDRTAISPDDPRVAIMFVAWSGTHREVQAERVGNYLEPLAGMAQRIVRQGIELCGFLEIDAYLRDNADPEDPASPLDEVFGVDVEYSFLPGFALGLSDEHDNPLPRAFIVNPDLCSPEEVQMLRKLMD